MTAYAFACTPIDSWNVFNSLLCCWSAAGVDEPFPRRTPSLGAYAVRSSWLALLHRHDSVVKHENLTAGVRRSLSSSSLLSLLRSDGALEMMSMHRYKGSPGSGGSKAQPFHVRVHPAVLLLADVHAHVTLQGLLLLTHWINHVEETVSALAFNKGRSSGRVLLTA